MKKLLFLFFLCILSASAFGQQVIWERTVGVSPTNGPLEYVTLPDGGFAAVNRVLHATSLRRFDSLRFEVWNHPFPTGYRLANGMDAMLKVVPGGFIVGLEKQDPDTFRIALVKVDWQGNQVWTKTIPTGRSANSPCDMYIKSPNEYILLVSGAIAGQPLSTGAGHKPIAISIDSMGNQNWRKIYQDPFQGIEVPRNILSHRANGYIFTVHLGLGGHFPHLIKTDLQGNTLQNQVLTVPAAPSGYITQAGNYIKVADGGIVFTGYNAGSLADNYTVVTKLDTSWNVLWSVTHNEFIGGLSQATNVLEMADSTLLVIGQKNNNNKIFLLKISPQGQVLDTTYVTVTHSTGSNGLMSCYLLPDSSLFYGSYTFMAKIGNVGLPMPAPVAPVVSAGSNDSVCVYAQPFTLSGFSPAGGSWSGNGVSAAGVFSPDSSLTGTHTLTYSVTASNGLTGTATKTVTVTPAPVADFTYSITGTAVSFSNSSAGAASYSWDFGNGSTSTLENPVYTYSSGGSFTVSLTAVTAAGCTATTAQNFGLTARANQLEKSVTLYPNPTNGLLIIDRTDAASEPMLVELFNNLGQMVKRAMVSAQQPHLDLAGLADGVYQVKLITGNAVVYRKVVLQK